MILDSVTNRQLAAERRAIPLARAHVYHIIITHVVCRTPKTLCGVLLFICLFIYLFTYLIRYLQSIEEIAHRLIYIY